ncbi:MAG: outer membrane protein assembly factor BamA [Bacteroidia bacterium]|nr:outer membrane protein assembly factor BamA [Bacteroidia bacterium]
MIPSTTIIRANLSPLKKMNTIFNYFVLIFLAWALANTQLLAQNTEKTYTLTDISIEGNQYNDNQAIIQISGLTIGSKITIPGQEVAQAIEKLWKQQIFSDIQINIGKIEGDDLSLIIKLSERPRISRFSFSGITRSQADDLREKIKFIRGTILTEPKKRTATRTIKNFFQEKGYYNVAVKITEKPEAGSTNAANIEIAINKGPRVKVGHIEIDGNTDIDDGKLKKRFKNTKEKRFYRIWARSKFIKGNFNEDKAKIVAFYNSRGYRDAQLISDTVIQRNEKIVDIKINVLEGKQYYFRNITFIGNNKYNSDYLLSLLNIRRGDIYNQAQLDKKLSMDPNGTDISSLYLDDGYLFFRADPTEILVEGDSIDIEIKVYEGPQATINKVYVEGNTKTADYVIIRELRTLPGDKFSRSDLIRSQRELLALGYFNQEKMNVIPIPDPTKGLVDLKYVVEERPSDQLQFQGGWTGRIRDTLGNVLAGGFIGTIGLTFNNFSTKKMFQRGQWRPLPSGHGQRLSLSIQLNGVNFQNYGISFMEPWFGGKKPNSFGVSFNYSMQRSPTLAGYRMAIFGTSVDLGRRLKFPDDYFRSYTSINYQNFSLRNAGAFIGAGDGQYNLLSLRQTFDRTSIDAPIYPRSGSQISLSIEATPPWGLILQGKEKALGLTEFHKWKFDASWFLKLYKNMVINAKFRTGFIGLYDKSKGVSPFGQFIMGGAGWQGFGGLFGRELVGLRGYNTFYDPTSANIFNKFTLEIRQPLTLEQSATVWLLAFAEAGNAWNGFKNYNPTSLRRSAGFGIRVFLPIFGLLGVDYGFAFDESYGAPKQPFQFIIGQQF